MGFVNWVKSIFGGKKIVSLTDCDFALSVDYFYKKLAVSACVDLIANAIARCEFQTFEKGKRTRANNFYLLNVQPNVNQNATEFWKELVSKLLTENECLVIMQDEQLYVADDYDVKAFVLRENMYENVTVGDLTFNKVFKESDVLRFKLNNENIANVIDGLYESFGKLLTSAMNFYKHKNNIRILIEGDFLRPQDKDTQDEIDKLFESQLKNWFDADKAGSAFQLQKGYEMTDMSSNQKSSAGSSNTSRDIADIINDIFSFVATAYHVPLAFLRGNVVDTEKQRDDFLMFGVNPITELIADELNRKIYSKEEYLQRTYLKVDTTKIKVTDLTKLATAVDKIFAVGGLTINDVIELIGGEPVDSDWANKRYVTKNYQEADSLEGGETS